MTHFVAFRTITPNQAEVNVEVQGRRIGTVHNIPHVGLITAAAHLKLIPQVTSKFTMPFTFECFCKDTNRCYCRISGSAIPTTGRSSGSASWNQQWAQSAWSGAAVQSASAVNRQV